MSAVEVSIVVPALNERRALPSLLEEIEAACSALDRTWEVVVVDDGSTDDSFELVEELAGERPWLRAVRLRRNFGKSAALATGFAYAAGEVIVTIDGDGQDDPADIPRLLAALDDGADLVSGWKRERRDPLPRRLASRFFNRVTSRSAGLRLHDMNCGLKAYRGECARSLEVYGELHRFIPVLASQQGWRVGELSVNHRPRPHGRSRFGTERYLRGALDLLTVSFLGRYQHRPLHLFGAIGLALTVVGLAISIYLTILWLGGEAIGDRPLLFLGVLLIVVGIQFLTFGLLGQMMVAAHRDRVSRRPDEPQVERALAGPGAPAPPAFDNERSAMETSAPDRGPRAAARGGRTGSSSSSG
jgi:glycosyltransferase involved in cell wall biosynthesis